MNENEMLKETEDAMKALSGFANACYDKGRRDTLISVAIGAGLVVAGYAATALYQIYKNHKVKKELRKSIDDFCDFVKEEKES